MFLTDKPFVTTHYFHYHCKSLHSTTAVLIDAAYITTAMRAVILRRLALALLYVSIRNITLDLWACYMRVYIM